MNDTRIESIFIEEMKGDTSFKTSPFNLFPVKYSTKEMKETWNLGIKHGIEIGLRRASLEGQHIELNRSIENERQKEFVDKFMKLCQEYSCAIQYSYNGKGMVIIDRNYGRE